MLRANAFNAHKSIRSRLHLLKAEPIQVLALLLLIFKYAMKKPQLDYKLGLFILNLTIIKLRFINYLFQYQAGLLADPHHGTHSQNCARLTLR